MANFEKAYNYLLQKEGYGSFSYSNQSEDLGGETYQGISRKYYPDWKGWKIIDNLKKELNFPQVLNISVELENASREFYIENKWNKIYGDKIPDQQTANEIFEQFVHSEKMAGRSLQIALNTLSHGDKYPNKIYNEILEDGIIGAKTVNALLKYLDWYMPRAKKEENLLLKIMNVRQMNYYINRTRQNPTQKKYIRGWLLRRT